MQAILAERAWHVEHLASGACPPLCIRPSALSLPPRPSPQAEQLLGATADELAALREGGGGGAYEAALRRATWTQWVLRLKAQAQ